MPTLYRYRNQVLCLDTAMGLTRGNPVGAWAVLDGLRMEYGTYTKVLRQGNGHPTMIGQIHYANGERAARLNFITPDKGLESPGLPALIESLAWDAGEHGALSLLAEVEESSPAFEALRRPASAWMPGSASGRSTTSRAATVRRRFGRTPPTSTLCPCGRCTRRWCHPWCRPLTR